MTSQTTLTQNRPAAPLDTPASGLLTKINMKWIITKISQAATIGGAVMLLALPFIHKKITQDDRKIITLFMAAMAAMIGGGCVWWDKIAGTKLKIRDIQWEIRNEAQIQSLYDKYVQKIPKNELDVIFNGWLKDCMKDEISFRGLMEIMTLQSGFKKEEEETSLGEILGFKLSQHNLENFKTKYEEYLLHPQNYKMAYRWIKKLKRIPNEWEKLCNFITPPPDPILDDIFKETHHNYYFQTYIQRKKNLEINEKNGNYYARLFTLYVWFRNENDGFHEKINEHRKFFKEEKQKLIPFYTEKVDQFIFTLTAKRYAQQVLNRLKSSENFFDKVTDGGRNSADFRHIEDDEIKDKFRESFFQFVKDHESELNQIMEKYDLDIVWLYEKKDNFADAFLQAKFIQVKGERSYSNFSSELHGIDAVKKYIESHPEHLNILKEIYLLFPPKELRSSKLLEDRKALLISTEDEKAALRSFWDNKTFEDILRDDKEKQVFLDSINSKENLSGIFEPQDFSEKANLYITGWELRDVLDKYPELIKTKILKPPEFNHAKILLEKNKNEFIDIICDKKYTSLIFPKLLKNGEDGVKRLVVDCVIEYAANFLGYNKQPEIINQDNIKQIAPSSAMVKRTLSHIFPTNQESNSNFASNESNTKLFDLLNSEEMMDLLIFDELKNLIESYKIENNLYLENCTKKLEEIRQTCEKKKENPSISNEEKECNEIINKINKITNQLDISITIEAQKNLIKKMNQEISSLKPKLDDDIKKIQEFNNQIQKIFDTLELNEELVNVHLADSVDNQTVSNSVFSNLNPPRWTNQEQTNRNFSKSTGILDLESKKYSLPDQFLTRLLKNEHENCAQLDKEIINKTAQLELKEKELSKLQVEIEQKNNYSQIQKDKERLEKNISKIEKPIEDELKNLNSEMEKLQITLKEATSIPSKKKPNNSTKNMNQQEKLKNKIKLQEEKLKKAQNQLKPEKTKLREFEEKLEKLQKKSSLYKDIDSLKIKIKFLRDSLENIKKLQIERSLIEANFKKSNQQLQDLERDLHKNQESLKSNQEEHKKFLHEMENLQTNLTTAHQKLEDAKGRVKNYETNFEKNLGEALAKEKKVCAERMLKSLETFLIKISELLLRSDSKKTEQI